MTSADNKQARFIEANDSKLQQQSKTLASDLENLARDFEIPILKLREEAREKALSDRRCEAAAANHLADRNEDLAQMLRLASNHIQTLETLRHGAEQATKVNQHWKKELETLKDRLSTAKENCSLKSCPKCGHLHQVNHICYSCGHDA